MRTLDMYIGRSFFHYFLFILFGLGFLFSLLEFIAQMDDVGRGQYQAMDAFSYVIFTLPGRILYLIPVSSLLGGIIALGLLADHNELVAMQAGGISVQRICWSVLVAAALPMLLSGLLAEYVVPPLEQQARARRLAALADTDITLTKKGFWARNGPYFIHVRTLPHGGPPADVDIFEWDNDGRLRVFIHARSAYVSKGNRWVLTDIERKTFTGQRITTQSLDTLTLGSFLSKDQLEIQKIPPENLSPSDLYDYVRLLQETGQNPDQYELVFWQKLSTPLATAAMVLLSLTFVFGPTRGSTAGFRITAGSIVGIVVHFLNQISGQIAIFLGLNLALAAMTPVAIIFCLALYLLSRGP